VIENIPIPGIEDYDKGFWSHTSKSQLVVQSCSHCNKVRFPPRPMCPSCHCLEHKWEKVSGKGEVWSFVVPRPPLLPAFEEISPYAVGLISLEEHPFIRMVGRLKVEEAQKNDDFELIKIGSKVEVAFEKLTKEICLPYWVIKENL